MKAIAILALVAFDLAAADSKSSAITVRIVPEVVVSVQGIESVGVKIRLSEMANAQVWIADNCSIPLAASTVIGQSGTYEIPIPVLPGSGRMVCLMSAADGLMEAVPLLVPKVADSVRCTNSNCYSM